MRDGVHGGSKLGLQVNSRNLHMELHSMSTVCFVPFCLWEDVIAVLGQNVQDMGFAEGTFDATGRAQKA